MSAPLYGEVCAGVGGLSRGLELAGLRAAFHAEIAPFPRRVLAHHWPETPLLSDLKAISGGRKMRAWMRRHFSGLLLLAGGTPCQDLSVAGKREGIFGLRSSLYFRFVRLWKVLGCPYLLWENVAGALSSNRGADFAAVLSAIVGAAVAAPSDGWGSAGVVSGPTGVAAWRLLDAQWFGVPQRRLRVFVLGARAGGVDPAEVLLEPQGVRGHPPTRGEAGQVTPSIPASGAGTARTGNARTESGLVQVVAFQPHAGPNVRGQAIGEECAGTLAGNGGGNAVPAVVSFDWQKGNDVTNPRPSTMNVTEEQTGTLSSARVPAVLAYDTTQVTSKANRSNPRAGDPCHPLAAGQHAPLVVCATGDVTHSLTHEGADASEDGTGRGTPIVALDVQNCLASTDVFATLDSGAAHGNRGPQVMHGIPRRLTPLECERLMGWPDQWTDVPDAKGKPASDAQRYKACGNGVVSAKAQWIGERLLALHNNLAEASA